jgi:hypothetical protein
MAAVLAASFAISMFASFTSRIFGYYPAAHYKETAPFKMKGAVYKNQLASVACTTCHVASPPPMLIEQFQFKHHAIHIECLVNDHDWVPSKPKC